MSILTVYPPLPDKRYQVIYADPPWHYKGQTMHNGSGGKSTGGSETHYPTINLEGLSNLDVPSIADDNCLLFLWATSPHLDQAIKLGEAWGFSWATVAFVWQKDKVNPGFYTLSQCELCCVMKKGTIPKPRGSRKERQLVVAPRQMHSRKPDEVRERIDAMFPEQSKIELFARQQNALWDAWGQGI